MPVVNVKIANYDATNVVNLQAFPVGLERSNRCNFSSTRRTVPNIQKNWTNVRMNPKPSELELL